MRLYIAAPIARRDFAKDVAFLLARHGHQIVSTWFDRVHQDVEPEDEETRSKALSFDLAELARAEVVVALVDKGRPRMTYVEVGFALAGRTPVVWLEGPERGCLADSHPLSIRVRSLVELPDAVTRAGRRIP